MKRISTGIAIAALAVSVSGCSLFGTPAATTNTTPPPVADVAVVTGSTVNAQAVFDALSATKGLTFSQNDGSSQLAEMKTGTFVSKLTKFMVTATKDTIDVTISEAKDAAKVAEIKAEIDAQFQMIKPLAPTLNYVFVDVGDPSAIVTVSWDKEDEATAKTVQDALVKLKK